MPNYACRNAAAIVRVHANPPLLPLKGLLRLCLWSLLALLLATGAMLVAALQAEPLVPQQDELAPEDVARAMSLLRSHDPRRAQPGMVSSALMQERDVEVLLSHGARRWLQANGRVKLQPAKARVALSLPAPPNPFGGWINLDLELDETGGLPVIARLHVGRLPVPAWLAPRLGLALIERAGLGKEWRLATEVARRVRFFPQQMLVTYAWQGDSMGRLLDGLLSAQELQRLRAYSDLLVSLSTRVRSSKQVALTELMSPLFALAQQRSAGADAAQAGAENRALLAVLTLYVNGRGVGSVAPAARAWPRARQLQVLLGGRIDFPLHFRVSAALATESSTPLSKAMGLYKEVADARHGSGFSFNDVAANRAGTRFGERITASAPEMQRRLAGGVIDADLLPRTDDLPEFMPDAEFRRRFGGVGAPAYLALLAEIDRRIADLPLFR